MSFGCDGKTYHEHVRIELAVNFGGKRLLREQVHDLVKLREAEADELRRYTRIQMANLVLVLILRDKEAQRDRQSLNILN